jgi:methylated-DNA-protein-cysteine methyltransferase-like protein
LRRAGSERRLPWHRVVAAQGRIALPGSAGLEQRLRLQQEGVPFRGKRVWLEQCSSLERA